METALTRPAGVVMDVTHDGKHVSLRTRGLVKFGQQELVVRRFPTALLSPLKGLLYNNVCRYTATDTTITDGEFLTFVDPPIRLAFTETPEGLLEISDADPERGALPGLDGLAKAMRANQRARRRHKTSSRTATR